MKISSLHNALWACLIGLMFAVPCAAQTSPPASAAVAERLQSLYPGTRFGAVNTTPWQGVFEVTVGPNLAYVDQSGQFFLFGHLYDMKAQRDLTAERKDTFLRLDFAGLPLDDAIRQVMESGLVVLSCFQRVKSLLSGSRKVML